MYQQFQKTYFIVIVIYIVAAVFLLGLVFWPQAYNIAQTSLAAKIVLMIATVVDLILFWSFSQLTVSLREDFLEFRFGIFKKRISYNQIREISVSDYDKKNFLGYGIRFGRDKSVGYIARGGRGVKIKTPLRDYYFSADNPEEIIKLVRTKL
jgi:hypothetical protein